MLRRILLVLDDSPGSSAALHVAAALSRRTGAAVTGAAIAQDPDRAGEHEAVPLGAIAFQAHRDETFAAQARAEAQAEFAELRQVLPDAATLLLEDEPEEALSEAAVTHDLIVIGRDATLGLGTEPAPVSAVLDDLVRHGPRPIIAVPPGAPAEGPILVAFGETRNCARSLHLFALLGLCGDTECAVVSVDEDAAAAAARVRIATELLASHGVTATPVPLQGDDPVEALLAEVAQRKPGLLVIGARGTSALMSLFSRSAEERLLRDSPCAIFISR